MNYNCLGRIFFPTFRYSVRSVSHRRFQIESKNDIYSTYKDEHYFENIFTSTCSIKNFDIRYQDILRRQKQYWSKEPKNDTN